MSQENMLEIRHLSKAFGKHVVLRDIDFNVKPGDVTCIIGASGSGKSTLLRKREQNWRQDCKRRNVVDHAAYQ